MPVIAAVIATIVGGIVVYIVVNSPAFETWFCGRFSTSKICADAGEALPSPVLPPRLPPRPAVPEGTGVEPPFDGREPGVSRDQ